MKKYIKEVDSHYSEVARIYGASKKSTMHNDFIRDTETEFIKSSLLNINQKESILDIGCGNGYTLDILNKIYNKNSIKIHLNGIEPNKDLFNISKKRLKKSNITLSNRGIFSLTKDQKFDVIICQRILINLLDKKDQNKALKVLKNLLKKDGHIILIECFENTFENLNRARSEFGLEKLKPSHHNLYLKRKYVLSHFKEIFFYDTTQFQKSLSVHYYLTRVIHQLFLDINQMPFKRNSPFLSFINGLNFNLKLNFSPINLMILKSK